MALVGLNLLEARSRSYYYSLANKFFDYIHAGVPSVNMNFPEYRKIIDRYPVGICIEELSANTIADAVRRITDTELQNKMITSCLEARMEFQWDREKEHLLSVINTLNG
jgi:glycosyltransferase involved in cell wall biosynthesis